MFWRWLFCLLEACVGKCKACAAWVLLCCYLAWARGMQISPKPQNAHERHVQDVQLESNARVELCGSFAIKGSHCTLAVTNVLDTATMPRLTAAQRERAIGCLTAGDDPQTVAAAFNVHFTTVYRLQQRFAARGVTDDRPRSRRPWVTTPRQDRQIFCNHQRDRFLTASETAQRTIGRHQAPISSDTVHRRLRARDPRNCRPARVPVITRRHRLACLQWARNHANWSWRQWRTVVFTDESRFCVSNADRRVRVWRRRGECFQDNCVMELDLNKHLRFFCCLVYITKYTILPVIKMTFYCWF